MIEPVAGSLIAPVAMGVVPSLISVVGVFDATTLPFGATTIRSRSTSVSQVSENTAFCGEVAGSQAARLLFATSGSTHTVLS